MTSRPQIDPVAADDLAELRRKLTDLIAAADDVGAAAELVHRSVKRALKPDEPTTAILAARAAVRRISVARELLDAIRDDLATVERWL